MKRNYLKALREQYGWSQQAVAHCLRISQQMYSAIENGFRQKNISLSMLEKLSGVYQVPVSQLIESEQQYKVLIKEAG